MEINEAMVKAQERAVLFEEANQELKNLLSRIKKEPMTRRTKEVFLKRRKEADELWAAIQDLVYLAEQSGECTRFGLIGKEKINLALEYFTKLGDTLDSWKGGFADKANCSLVHVSERAIQCAVARRVIDRYSGWEDENQTVDDLEYMATKLKSVLNDFELKHEKIPEGHKDWARMESEAVELREKVVSMVSGIMLKLSERSDRTVGPKELGEPVIGSSTQLEQVIKLVRSLGNTAPTTSNIKLPRLELPHFDGQLNNWLYFKGAFKSAVHLNPSIDSTLKMRYLQSCLMGEAKLMFAQFALNDDNYTTAWELLCKRYDNKKLLINTYLERLLNIRPAKVDSAAELKGVLDKFNEAVCSLKNLGEVVWNAMVVHILCSKLPDETIRAWEQSLRNEDAFPAFEELDVFLESRINTLTLLEGKRIGPQKGDSGSSSSAMYTSVAGIPKSIQCSLCDGAHMLHKCGKFLAKNVTERNDFVKFKKLCSICLNDHRGLECKFKWNCKECRERHNTLLHRKLREKAINAGVTDGNFVLLPTATITLMSEFGVPFTFKALIDQGSSVSAVSEHLMALLKWKRNHKITSLISGVGDTQAECRGSTEFYIYSRYDRTIQINVNAIIMGKVTKALPRLADKGLVEFINLDLADPNYFEGGKIDLILGSDIIPSLLLDHTIRGTLLAQQTHLGYILSGPVKSANSTEGHSYGMIIEAKESDDGLTKFWETEEKIIEHSGLSQEEEECERIYKETTFVGPDGRYVCRLPFKSNSALGKSRHIALANFYSLEKRFEKDAKFKERYCEAMANYFQLNHAHIAPPLNMGEPHYYIPHLAVVKEASTTTKTRIVFNASSPTSNLKSLNDVLMVGPRIQNGIVEKILLFRLHKIVFTCDIVKMYRQININPDDFSFQRFIWRIEGEVKDCYLSTVTFGMASAPFTAVRTLAQLAEDRKDDFPLGAHILKTKAYVDDIHYGGEDEIDVYKGMNELINLLKSASFEVRKFSSNNKSVINDLPADYVQEEVEQGFLGIIWNSDKDFLKINRISFINNKQLTKRMVLQNIAKIFDPLGWFQPIVVCAKIFMQDIWRLNLKWDDLIPAEFHKRWIELEKSLSIMHTIEIPRYFSRAAVGRIELHGFSDASGLAYGAVIYMKRCPDDQPWLIIAKSRVSPLKHTSIPRLELKGALLLSDLMCNVRNLLESEKLVVSCYGWSDSKVALAWMKGPPEKWQPFVRNRVAAIKANVPDMVWRYVATADNPADVVSRGCDANTFRELKFWFRGPLWLHNGFYQEAAHQELERNDELAINKEMKKEVILLVAQVLEVDWVVETARTFSSFKFAGRVFAWVKRFLYNSRNVHSKIKTNFISVSESLDAEKLIIRRVQHMHFPEDIDALVEKSKVSQQSVLRSMCPFLDGEGTLRVGGRIQKANIKFDQRHPMIVPGKEPLVTTIIREAHKMSWHGGFATTMNSLRKRFWIVKGGQIVKGVVRNCVSCIKARPSWSTQLMGMLPAERVQLVTPFMHTGVDFAGPVKVRATTGRGVRCSKGYIAVFVCMSVKAFHLEVVSSLTAESFLAALNRLISRRGPVQHLYSDNGTNFVGAFKRLSDINGQLSRKGIDWSFMPPLSPNFGGLWEAGVKSVKTHLAATCSADSFTFEELSTLLCGVETTLNSRPLCPLVEDVDSLDALTPQHFLSQGAPMDLDGRDLREMPMKYLSRWECIQKARQNLCWRYRDEYLSRLNNRPKNLSVKTNLVVGQLVLLREESCGSRWPLARITAIHPGSDGLTRVVTLRTASGEKKRSISKICPLGTVGVPDMSLPQ
jgi:hypothetical protein